MAKAPFLFLSGCRFTDTGGAQRPPQLAKALASMGHEVAYHNRLHRRYERVDGVDVLPECDVLSWGNLAPSGVVVCSLAEYLPFARQLSHLTLVYDCLDDWDGFVNTGELHGEAVRDESKIVQAAALVTATAPRLVEKVTRLGAKQVVFIRNGGPEEPLPRGKHKSGRIRVVYSGYLSGSWRAWDLLQAVAEDPGMDLTVVGYYDNAPAWARPGVFVGELDHAKALRVMADHDVGIIPFRGELCRAVDPIKYYDYLAAGLWTVSTRIVEPMIGRPYVVTVPDDPAQFCDGVKLAALNQLHNPPDADLVRGSAWSQRARQLLGAVAPLLPTRRRAVRTVPRHREPLQTRLRVTWEAPATCNMRPVCPYCNNSDSRRGKPALSAAWGHYAEGFARLAKSYGPLYLSVCFGEPLSSAECLRVVAEVAKGNKVDLSSNILAPVPVLDDMPRNGNVAIATSFHPHAWRNLDDFLAKRRAIEAEGIQCGIASIVATPEHLDRLADWCAELKAENVVPSVLPFWGMYGGKTYPAGYTEAEWDLLRACGVGEPGQHLTSRQGQPCRTGKDYVFVAWDGTIRRCYHPSAEVLGSLIDESDIRLNEGATPCPAAECPCPDLWQFCEVAP